MQRKDATPPENAPVSKIKRADHLISKELTKRVVVAKGCEGANISALMPGTLRSPALPRSEAAPTTIAMLTPSAGGHHHPNHVQRRQHAQPTRCKYLRPRRATCRFSADWFHVGDERLTLLLVVSVQLGGATQHRYGPRQRLQPAANAWRTTVCVFIICIRSMNVAAALARLLGRVCG